MHVRDVPLGRKFLPKPGRIVRDPGTIRLRCDACVICFSWARSLLVGLSIDALLVRVPSTRRVTSSSIGAVLLGPVAVIASSF